MAVVMDSAAVVTWGGDGQPGAETTGAEIAQSQTTLVFLHYFGGAASSWHWVAKPLAKKHGYRCFALNLPGFASTPPPQTVSIDEYAKFIAQTVAQQGIDDYVLIGHSMGGKLAMQVAIDQTHPPKQLILIAPSPATTEPMPEEEKQRMISKHPSRENAEITLQNAAKQPLTTEQRELAIQTHMQIEDGVWRWWLRQGMENSIADRVGNISIPVTILASKDDPVIPFEAVQTDIIDLIPNSKLVSTQNVGHLIPLEQPDWVVEQIVAAIAS